MKYNQPFGISDPEAPYINGDPSTGTMGSIPPAASIEYPQREIVNLIGHAAITPANTDLNQLAKAVQGGKLNYAADAGTANAYQITVAPALTAYAAGNQWLVKIANTNTGPSTININGVGARQIVLNDGSALAGGELIANGLVLLGDDGTKFRILSSSIGPLGGGRVALTGVRIFSTPGTTVYTPSVGTRAVFVEVQGAGGGGSGSAATTSAQHSVGISGGAGGYARKWITSGFAGVNVTVGAGGAGGSAGGGVGGTGGTSSFGGIMSCTGGGGGPVGDTRPNTAIGGTTTAAGGNATGGDINTIGQCSQTSLFQSSTVIAGVAGSCMYGSSPIAYGVSANGEAGNGFGAGGTAGVSVTSSSAHSGGAGAKGLVFVWEYA